MVDIIPPIFSTPSSTIATYDFIDFAKGEATTTLYLADIEGGSTTLTSNSGLYGKEGVLTITDLGTVDADFDAEVGKPFDSGTIVYFTLAHAVNTNTSITPAGSQNITVYVRKYSDSTETDLGSTVVTWRTGTFGSGYHFTPLVGKVTIASTHFKIGDKVRITISATFGNFAGMQTWYFGTDPVGRATTKEGLNWSGVMPNGRSVVFFPIRLPNL